MRTNTKGIACARARAHIQMRACEHTEMTVLSVCVYVYVCHTQGPEDWDSSDTQSAALRHVASRLAVQVRCDTHTHTRAHTHTHTQAPGFIWQQGTKYAPSKAVTMCVCVCLFVCVCLSQAVSTLAAATQSAAASGAGGGVTPRGGLAFEGPAWNNSTLAMIK